MLPLRASVGICLWVDPDEARWRDRKTEIRTDDTGQLALPSETWYLGPPLPRASITSGPPLPRASITSGPPLPRGLHSEHKEAMRLSEQLGVRGHPSEVEVLSLVTHRRTGGG
ncbi:hypothetical protein NHX12_029100 [Muraenolepis orangiensis]|uniref:Uncharacterized protein n=1 Tax=Muraenolepis orangiensis TaxID=630683 RepID=A0A9Q0IMU8_9TELE|nr:hypothetical protein NHX12_029100 [Muraenolepis orangiensis]